jgi:uncharacterized membrane protein SpoIIM required for sporulation
MRETAFLKQNEKKWKEFESLVHAKKGMVPPDKIAELFIEVTDDLAYARTHYPQSTTTKYLNGLAGQLHQAIVRNKKPKSGGIKAFWLTELPKIMYETRHKLVYAFLIFMVAIVIGAISTNYDINFVRTILGDDYVDMTLRNIERGNPLGVYGTGGEVDMFLSITINNVKVSFLAFVMGLLCSAGTAYILFSNGIMVGAFFTFLFKHGFVQETILTVMLHGTLELSAIVIAGSAGFCVGHSILFPRTFSRLESLRMGALKGMKIIIGLIPVFVAAGFIESFLTRYTNMPAPVSLLIIIGSLGFIIYYFIVYPMQLHGNDDRPKGIKGILGAMVVNAFVPGESESATTDAHGASITVAQRIGFKMPPNPFASRQPSADSLGNPYAGSASNIRQNP